MLLALPMDGPAVGQTLPTADELFARGVQLHQSGDIVGAIEAYQAALEKEPDRVDARSNLGAAFARLGRYAQAIEQYRSVLTRIPDQVQVRFNLALALYKAAEIPQAHEEFKRVVEQEPANRNAALLLADCYLQLGRDAAVVDLLSPRETEFADDRLFAYLMGNALIRRNELLRGQTYIDRLFRGGESAEAHVLMGAAHVRRGEGAEAVMQLTRALELNPTLPSVHSLLGRAFIQAGQRDAAAQAFREELARSPNDFDANVYLGLLLKDENALDESYELLTRAGRLRPQDPAVLYALGALHLAAGRVDEAQRALEVVTTKVPDYRQAHVLLATVYYRQKKKELGDRERSIVERLTAQEQSREPGASDELGPAYKGDVPSPPRTRDPGSAPQDRE